MTRPGSARLRALGWAEWGLAAGLLAVAAVFAAEIASLSVWRHDSLWSLVDFAYPFRQDADAQGAYFHKLRAEGRWLNWLLANQLVAIPGALSALVCLGAVWAFAFVAARRLGASPAWAGIAAGIALLAPPNWGQALWPAAALPAFVLLALAIPASRVLRPVLFFPLFAVPFFGTIFWPYYLLPILYLGRYARARRGEVLGLGAVWLGGFALGYGVMLAATHRLTGQWGLEIQGWRDPNPLTGLGAFLENAASRWDLAAEVTWIYAGGWLGLAVIAALLVLRAGQTRRTGACAGTWAAPAILLAVMASHYAATMINGIRIGAHVFGFYLVPLTLLLFAWPMGEGRGRALALMGAAWLGAVQVTATERDVTQAVRINRAIIEDVRPLFAGAPPPEGVLLLDGSARTLFLRLMREEGLQRTLLLPYTNFVHWRPAIQRVAAHRVVPCARFAWFCEQQIDQQGRPPCEMRGRYHCHHGRTESGWAVISIALD